MKKLSVLSMMVLLSGCACFQSDAEETYVAPEAPRRESARPMPSYNQPQDYRQRAELYIYDDNNNPRPQNVMVNRRPGPRPVYDISVQDGGNMPPPPPLPAPTMVQNNQPQYQPTPMTTTTASCGDIKSTESNSTLPDGSPCPAQVKETREPVEIVYKKTTAKTVYEPKTTTTVTYEKEPYVQTAAPQVIQEVTPQTNNQVEEISVQTEYETMPNNEIK